VEHDEEILMLPAARPEFINLSEAEVRKVIDEDPWQCNPITGEVTRLVVQCMTKFKAHFGQPGYVPPRILRIEARCPIEKVAVLLVVRFMEAEAGLGLVTVQ
jgi:hypothetical protein